MRIAFLNRGRETHPGGDLIAIDETMAALRRLGVECEETGWDAERIKNGNFDLCHMFHCNFDWSWGNYHAIQKAGKRYVLTPIYYPEGDGLQQIPLLCGISEDQCAEMIDKASMICPFSQCEYDELITAPWPEQIRIIPNGTSRAFHFHSDVSNRIECLVVSARGKSDKNAEKIEAACNLKKIPFRLAAIVDRKNMPRVYTQARVFVNASESERMSLTIGEALCAGCQVLATKENRGNEWYGPGLYTFDPKESVEVLAERIRTAYECSDDDWDWSPNIKARKLTWDLTAAMLKQVYQEVLA